MNSISVIDHNKQPLAPCSPRRARLLLARGKAAVYKRFPFVIILKREVTNPSTPPLRLKFDPGSKTTGIAIVNDATGEIVFAAELSHRGDQIKAALDRRRVVRRNRRQRKTRYRQPRLQNRRRPKGWLPPSLQTRVENIATWTRRLLAYYPISALSLELNKFDTQLLRDPEISGVEYQQGALVGYELREYLLEKWQRRCAYCGKTTLPLQIEHMVPRSRHGSNRASNLCLSCGPCNQKKGNLTAAEFGFPHLQALAQQPLRDAAAVNATRWAVCHRLKSCGLPLEIGSGGLTKFNRMQRGLPKTHWLDAACVGASTPEHLINEGVEILSVKATGHGSRQMCRVDRYGFPRTSAKGKREVKGFQTGDLVIAAVPKGKKAGRHQGRVAVRSCGFFNITTKDGTIQGVGHKYCTLMQRRDGYAYTRVCRGLAFIETIQESKLDSSAASNQRSPFVLS